jgi:pimeloyl-[acyl-carrier protein] methyl ester esterase
VSALVVRPPKLVVLPGLDGTGQLLSRLRAVTPQHMELSVLSYPSHGPQDYATLERSIAPRLPRGERYMLVAESFGGPLALRLAAPHPPGLSAVVLVNSFLSSPLDPAQTLAVTPLLPLATRLPPPDALLRRFMLGDDAETGLIDELRAALRSVPAGVLAARIRQVLMANEAVAYLRCHLPMFYLQGTEDRLLGPRSLERLIHLRPGLQLEQVRGPHLLLQREPRASMRVLQAIAERSFER